MHKNPQRLKIICGLRPIRLQDSSPPFFLRDSRASVKITPCSLVPRPVRAIRVTRGGLEPSAIARIFPTSLTGDVISEIAEDNWERGCTPRKKRRHVAGREKNEGLQTKPKLLNLCVALTTQNSDWLFHGNLSTSVKNTPAAINTRHYHNLQNK